LSAAVFAVSGAVLLARDGHDVTILARDNDPLPDSLPEAAAARSSVSPSRATPAASVF